MAQLFHAKNWHIHGVISCAIAKGGALRERGQVRTSGGSISLVGNGTAYNVWIYAPCFLISIIKRVYLQNK